MKKYLYSAIAVVLIAGAVQAQHVNIGIKGGLNAYTLVGNNNPNFDPKLSFYAGLLGHIHMGPQFAIQPEIFYSGQGAKARIAGVNTEIKLDYVNVPVLFQYMFDNGFRLQAGPQLGILVNAKSVTSTRTDDVSANFKNTDVGITVGMSYVKPSTGFGFDLRYNHGFTNINESSLVSTYNRGVQVGVFYLFGHKS